MACSVSGALLSCVLATTLGGQESVVPPAVQSAEGIQERIRTLESAKDIEDAVKARVLEIYRQTLTRAREYESYVGALSAYKELAASAPQTVQGIRQALKKPLTTPDLRALEDDEIAKTEALLTRKKTELQALRNTLDVHAATIATQDVRPRKIRDELTLARERLKSVETELALPQDANEPTLVREAAEENDKVLEEPDPAVFFVGFGDSSLNFEVRVFVKELSNRARTRIVHELHMTIDQLFREHGVVIAFPQQDLHIKSDERYKDGPPPYSREFDPGLE